MPLKNLTDEQLEAVLYKGNLLLTACPGSGKTKTLVSKLAHMLTAKDPPLGKKWIIAITYTNVAAETILDRLDQLGIDSANLWVGTIHSFCLEWIIKPYSCLSERLSKGYRIADQYEQLNLIQQVKSNNDIEFFDDVPTRLRLDMSIDAAQNSRFHKAASEYHYVLTEEKLIDFDLILSLTNQLLNNNSLISKNLANLFESILVDEYQDTNQIQYNIISAIINHGCVSIVLIGDVDQAIYTGLGAIVKNLNELNDELSVDSIEEKSLTGCFRSTQKIIDFYKNFQDNTIDIESLFIGKQEPSSIYHEGNVHKDNLAEFVSKIIQNKIDEGVDTGDIVVLAPSWWSVISLGNELKKIAPNIPINSPSISPIPRSLDNYWYDLIRLYFTELSVSNFSRRKRLARKVVSNINDMGFGFDENKYTSKKVIKYINVIVMEEGVNVVDFVEYLIYEFCTLMGVDIESSKIGMESKTSMLESIHRRINDHELDESAKQLYSYFRGSDGVKVTTCHSTKGEEYDVVIATSLLHGKLPNWGDIINCSQAHTDYVARRLLYVISSRAKRYLYLISEDGHTTQRGNPYNVTEQLIDAIN